MRRRAFRMRGPEAALLYAELLIESGVSFSVECNVNYLDLATPFEIAPDLFPLPEWLKQ